jgi:hypothetical protein
MNAQSLLFGAPPKCARRLEHLTPKLFLSSESDESYKGHKSRFDSQRPALQTKGLEFNGAATGKQYAGQTGAKVDSRNISDGVAVTLTDHRYPLSAEATTIKNARLRE